MSSAAIISWLLDPAGRLSPSRPACANLFSDLKGQPFPDGPSHRLTISAGGPISGKPILDERARAGSAGAGVASDITDARLTATTPCAPPARSADRSRQSLLVRELLEEA
jgi:hypothetical protein